MIRLRAAERSHLSDVENLYVVSSRTGQRVQLRRNLHASYQMVSEKDSTAKPLRTITVSAFPALGMLASEVMTVARPELDELQRQLPPGYTFRLVVRKKSRRRDLATSSSCWPSPSRQSLLHSSCSSRVQ